jgi:hypothetical protein
VLLRRDTELVVEGVVPVEEGAGII